MTLYSKFSRLLQSPGLRLPLLMLTLLAPVAGLRAALPGESWTVLAGAGNRNWKAVGMSADGSKMAAAAFNGYLYTSTDAGATWTPRMTDVMRSWKEVALSADGTRMTATAADNPFAGQSASLFTSTDAGVTWTRQPQGDLPSGHSGLAMSADGQTIFTSGGSTWRSWDGGISWELRASGFGRIFMGADPQNLSALGEADGKFYNSANGGITWSPRAAANSDFRFGAHFISPDGNRIVASALPIVNSQKTPGPLYNSTDGGNTFTARTGSRLWEYVTGSTDGYKLAATGYNEQIHTSIDAGATWTARESSRTWSGIASSRDGTRLVAWAGGALYTSSGTFLPEIAVEHPLLTSLTDGTGIVALDPAGVNTTSAAKVITVRNTGPGRLTLGTPVKSGTYAAEFTLNTAGMATTLGAGETTSFNVTFSPITIGLRTAQISFTNNDADESPFDLTIQGTGLTVYPGATWTLVAGTLNQGWQSVASSADGRYLVAGQGNGTIHSSSNFGDTWGLAPDLGRSAPTVASSASGSIITAAFRYTSGGTIGASPIYRGTRFGIDGISWTPQGPGSEWLCLAMSADGTTIAAGPSTGAMQLSRDAGATWTPQAAWANPWAGIACSADGTRLVGVGAGIRIWTSSNSGATWVSQAGSPVAGWTSVACSADGTKIAATVQGGQIYTSADAGATWTPRESNRQWFAIACSADGTKLIAGERQGQLYISTDAGVNWVPRETNRYWTSVASSADGTRLVAMANTGIYTSGGIYPREISIEQPVGSALADGGTRDFGTQFTGVSGTPVSFTVRNVGLATVTLSTVTVDGVHAGDFTVTQPVTSVLAPGATTTFSVRFSPTSSGARTAALHLASDADGAFSSYDAVLTGTGVVNVAPSFTLPPGGLPLTVSAQAGAQTISSFATSISAGPASESTQTVSFLVTNNNNALFSEQPAISSDGTLTFTPALIAAGGTATVTVAARDTGGTASGGVDTSAAQTFSITVPAVLPPTVASIAPGTGLTTGGTSVTITGTGFTGATGVTFGGTAATGVTVVNATTITATTPARSAGPASVVVTTLGGSNAANTLFHYHLPAVPTTIGTAPVNRAINDGAGGQVYLFTGVTGTAGQAASWTFFDNEPGTRVVTPLLFEKTSNTQYILRGVGTSRTTNGSGVQTYPFGLVAGTDVVTGSFTFGFTDRSVSASGGVLTTTAQYTGSVDWDYGSPTQWIFTPTQTFDLALAREFNINGTTSGNAVRLDSETRSYSAQFTFEPIAAPTVTAVTPASGSTVGGTSVTITGTGFTGATGVTIGGTPATGVTAVNATTITCITPAGAAGTASVAVTTPGGTNAVNTLFVFSLRSVPVGSSSLIGTLHYSDSFTTGAGATVPARVGYAGTFPLTSGVAVVENSYGNPARTWSTSAFSIATDAVNFTTTDSPYPGSSGGGSATGLTQTGATPAAGSDWSIPYGLSNDFLIQFDAVQMKDRVDVTIGTTGGNIQGTGNLSLFMRPSNQAFPQIGIYKPGLGEFNTGLTSGIATAGQWHNYAVRVNIPAQTIQVFINQISRGVINLATINGGAYAPFLTNGFVGIGGAGNDRIWTDNFQVGSPIGANATVANVTPATGSTAGGTSVTITGTGFTGATGVTFGGTAATGFTVVSATSITATTPAKSAGTASVVVTTPGGSNTVNTLYTYLTPVESWRQAWYGTTANTGNAADSADPYHTGVSNLLTFAFFGPAQDPALAKISLLPKPILTAGNFTANFPQPPGVSGITYGAEWSPTLTTGTWQAIPDTGSGSQHIFNAPVGTNSKLFMRLKVTLP